MPGGSGLVAFKSGDAAQEEAAAKFVAWMGSTDIAREWYSKTFAIPAHAGLQAEGLDYIGNGASQAVSDGLAAFTAMAATAAEQTPQAYQLQGSPKGFVMYNATVQYVGAALNGELSLDEAMAKVQEELDTNANQ